MLEDFAEILNSNSRLWVFFGIEDPFMTVPSAWVNQTRIQTYGIDSLQIAYLL